MWSFAFQLEMISRLIIINYLVTPSSPSPNFLKFLFFFFFFFLPCPCHAEFPRPGIKHVPQNGQCQMLNPLGYQGTPGNPLLSHSKAFFSKRFYSLFSQGAIHQFQVYSFRAAKTLCPQSFSQYEKSAPSTDSLILNKVSFLLILAHF